MRIALIAHDERKPTLIEFARDHETVLNECDCLATGTTGARLAEETDLEVDRVASGSLGGDVMIGATVASGDCDAVIFLRDPMIAHPHEPDIAALVRLCDVHDVPLATNPSSAHAIIEGLAEERIDPGDRNERGTPRNSRNGSTADEGTAIAVLTVVLFAIAVLVGSHVLGATAFPVTTVVASAALAVFMIVIESVSTSTA